MQPSIFQLIGYEIGSTVTKKNEQYGDACILVGKIMELLFPNGIPVERMTEALIIVRDLDKTCRIACPTGTESTRAEAWSDKAGYAIIGVNAYVAHTRDGMGQSQGTAVRVTS